MFKDDRMMSLLTVVVALLAIGTFAQRTEMFGRLFGDRGAPAVALVDDQAVVRPGQPAAVDVLANDVGITEGDRDRLTIAAQPECGRAVARGGLVSYIPAGSCRGTQTIVYALGEGPDAPRASLRVTILPAGGAPAPDAPAGPATEREPDVATSGAVTDRTGGGAGGDAAGPPPATATAAAEQAMAGPERCTVPAAVTIDPREGALTEIVVEAPCEAGTTAELRYSGLRFAIPLDGEGAGSLVVPGFEAASDAELRLASGARIALNIPFAESGRVTRVAVAWDAPSELEVIAREFADRAEAARELDAARRRSPAEALRTGGGFLLRYRPHDGLGEHIEVYSFWHRPGAGPGLVRLELRPVDAAAACAAGTLPTVDYMVLRSIRGRPERPRWHRLGPALCPRLALGAPLAEALEDVVVR